MLYNDPLITKRLPLLNNKIYRFRATLKSLVVLFPLLGITWLFGLLVFATQNVVFQYLFALSNTMQVWCHFITNKYLKTDFFIFYVRAVSHFTKTAGKRYRDPWCNDRSIYSILCLHAPACNFVQHARKTCVDCAKWGCLRACYKRVKCCSTFYLVTVLILLTEFLKLNNN